jgi:peptidoglycan/LPS O-acetylase OafA/YrhL
LDFFTGVLTYNFYKYFENKAVKTSVIYDLIFILICGIMLSNASGKLGDVRYLDFITVLVFFPSLIIFAIKGKIVSSFLNNIVLRSLGKLSYSIYLTHFPVQLLFYIFVLAGFDSIEFEKPTVILFYFLVTIVFSFLSYNFIEKPFQNYIIVLIERKRPNRSDFNKLYRQRL